MTTTSKPHLVLSLACVCAMTCLAGCEDGGVKYLSKPDAASPNIAAPAMNPTPDPAAAAPVGPTLANVGSVEPELDTRGDAGEPPTSTPLSSRLAITGNTPPLRLRP